MISVIVFKKVFSEACKKRNRAGATCRGIFSTPNFFLYFFIFFFFVKPNINIENLFVNS